MGLTGLQVNSSVALTMNLDVNQLIKDVAAGVENAIARETEREVWLRSTMNVLAYATRQSCNVAVCNWSSDPDWTSLRHIMLTGDADFRGVRFGIWVFHSGRLHVRGDLGPRNWIIGGSFRRFLADGTPHGGGPIVEFAPR